MAFLRRNVPFLVKSCNFRFSSDNRGSSFWDIIHKQWRVPRFQQPKPSAMNVKLSPSTSTIKFADKLNIFAGLKRRGGYEKDKNEGDDHLEQIVEDESQGRVSNVAVAQYAVFHGAKVKFSSIPEWIDEENHEKMPSVTDITARLEGIDISYTDTDYGRIKPFKNLHSVRLFYAEGCKSFNDYCLDYISSNLRDLEELDLRHCPLITSRGLGVLYRFKKLRKLQLDGVTSDAELELMCMLLEEHFPNLRIEGVTYEADKKSQ